MRISDSGRRAASFVCRSAYPPSHWTMTLKLLLVLPLLLRLDLLLLLSLLLLGG